MATGDRYLSRRVDDDVFAQFENLSLQPTEPQLTVSVQLHNQTSKQTGSIAWTYGRGWRRRTVDGWVICLRNLTWEQNDYSYDEKCFSPITGAIRSYTFPLWFRPSNRYRLTVKGYSCRQIDHFGNLGVVCEKSVEFRTGEVLPMSGVSQLRQAAEDYLDRYYNAHPSSCRARVCTYLYRNKSGRYFDDIFRYHGGVMETYLKDASGDPKSPINGELHGLFFFANVNQHGQPFTSSPFGDTRLLIHVEDVLQVTPNMYFADFHCSGNNKKAHHVTLLLTRTGSKADQFCRSRLPRMDLNSNPFLYREGGKVMVAEAHAAHVDVFVTEDLNIGYMLGRRIAVLRDNIPLRGTGTTSQGGKQGEKTHGCEHCDIFPQTARNTSHDEVY